ncbi:MAG: hypothetical protein K9J24_10030 [Bacteroidales bacterium]|nr:hypothetical protein [Bacteroidales bacterium]
MIYRIILYLIFVLPISIIFYKKDGKKWILIKLLNSIITLYLFLLLSGNLQRFIVGLNNDSYLILKDVPYPINVAISFIYGIVSFFTIIQAIRLAFRREKARKLIFWLIPILWILTGIDKYYVSINNTNNYPSLSNIIIVNSIYALVWGGIFIFYKLKNTKQFFAISPTQLQN